MSNGSLTVIKLIDMDVSLLEKYIENGELVEFLESAIHFCEENNAESLKHEIFAELGRLNLERKRLMLGIIKHEDLLQVESKIRNLSIGFLKAIKLIDQKGHIVEHPNPKMLVSLSLKSNLFGVWKSKYSSTSGNKNLRFWSLFPTGICLNNSVDAEKDEIRTYFATWDYDDDSSILTEKHHDGTEVCGMVEWQTEKLIKITVLNFFKPIILYEKIL